MQYSNHHRAQVQFDMLTLTLWQIRLARVAAPVAMLLIIFLPVAIIQHCWPGGWLGLAAPTVGILISAVLWLGCGFLLMALFRGTAMIDAAQQQELLALFAAYPELCAYRDRVYALGRGFTQGEYDTLRAWPAMKMAIADDLDSAA